MKIGIFDSGYGGLTILTALRRHLPDFDYVYLGDNARAPYGNRSFDVIYRYTLQCVEELFAQDCALVILACNTASARALRTIQQNDLPRLAPSRRVLGIIIPTVEAVASLTKTQHVGLLGTVGTVKSRSYDLELQKHCPTVHLTSQACPMWVPLVENGEHETPGAEYFVEKRLRSILAADPLIDTLILGCTHYPLLMPLIQRHTPEHVRIVEQGDIVAESLKQYLARHTALAATLTRGGRVRYLTTEDPRRFAASCTAFLSAPLPSAGTPLPSNGTSLPPADTSLPSADTSLPSADTSLPPAGTHLSSADVHQVRWND